MKRFALVAIAALSVSAVFAQGKKPAPAAPAQVNCPVTQEKLGSMGAGIQVAYTGKLAKYKGKKITVCCGGCVGTVKKDPDKYFKMVLK